MVAVSWGLEDDLGLWCCSILHRLADFDGHLCVGFSILSFERNRLFGVGWGLSIVLGVLFLIESSF